MSEEDDIEIAPEDQDWPKPKWQLGYKSLALGIVIASLLGAGGGAILSTTLQKPALDISPVTTDIETLQSESKTLKAQIARLEQDVKSVPKSKPVNLTPLKARLNALESAVPQEIDPELVARLEALKEEGSEALDLSDILARLEALESRPSANIPDAATTTASAASQAIPFPEAEILAALESSQPAGGWLKRSLKKHISVQSDENPYFLVEQTVSNIESGNIEAALTAFDKLPAEAKAAAAGWRKSLAD